MTSTEGYEIHQKLRTKAVRLLKKKDYPQCISILYSGSKQLLSNKEQGSGCDLACYMIQVYSQSDVKVDDQSRDRITDLLQLTQNDFWRKKVLDAAIKWSATAGDSPHGDWKLRLSAGKLLAKDGSYYDAEKQLLSSCLASPTPIQPESSEKNSDHPAFILAKSTFDWLESFAKQSQAQNGDSDGQSWESLVRLGSGSWAIRCVIPLVVAESLSSASLFLSTYLKLLTESQPKMLLPIQPNPKPYVAPISSSSKVEPRDLYITGSSDLNFIQMVLALIVTCDSIKRQGTAGPAGAGAGRVPEEMRNQWINMVNQWRREGGEDETFLENLSEISEIYFGIVSRKQGGNFIGDMMSSLMGGPSMKQEDKGIKVKNVKQAPKPVLAGGHGHGQKSQEERGKEDKEVDQKEGKVQPPEEEDLD